MLMERQKNNDNGCGLYQEGHHSSGVSTRETVAGSGSITSGAGKGPATAKDAHCLRLSIINDDNDRCSCRHPPPLRRVTITIRHCPRPHALPEDVDLMATIQDDVLLSKIVVPIANAKDGEEGREWRVEGGGHCDCSQEE